MAKDESGHLQSKVTTVARNPSSDRLAPKGPEAVVPADGYSREMLKEIIQRRKNNDFVRRREFDMLRKLLQKEAVGGVDTAYSPSSFNASALGKPDGRAQTIKKINEIEKQMSRHWWKSHAPSSQMESRQGLNDISVSADVMSAQHARAYADTVPGGVPMTAIGEAILLPVTALPIHLEEPAEAPLLSMIFDPSIEEASIRFAGGHDISCETVLLKAIEPGSPGAGNDSRWRALFDLYRAMGENEKFERMYLRYVHLFNRPGPRWLAFQQLAQALEATRPSAASQATNAVSPKRWTCAAHLTRAGLSEMMKVLGVAGPVWVLDWRGLSTIDLTAVAPLKALFTHWGNTPVQLQFSGVKALLAVLVAATPTGDKNTAVVWWDLRMSVLRAMHETDDFELVALNYCLTYEASPPLWKDPQCGYTSSDLPPSASTSEDSVNTLPVAKVMEPALLVGNLSGDLVATLHQFDIDLAGSKTLEISCAALLRMDFRAAGTLLIWVKAQDASGVRVQFTDAHWLIAAFFDVVGIANHASVTIRTD